MKQVHVLLLTSLFLLIQCGAYMNMQSCENAPGEVIQGLYIQALAPFGLLHPGTLLFKVLAIGASQRRSRTESLIL